MISDAHEGLKAAVAKVLSATWQRCRVHFMRNDEWAVQRARYLTLEAPLSDDPTFTLPALAD